MGAKNNLPARTNQIYDLGPYFSDIRNLSIISKKAKVAVKDFYQSANLNIVPPTVISRFFFYAKEMAASFSGTPGGTAARRYGVLLLVARCLCFCCYAYCLLLHLFLYYTVKNCLCLSGNGGHCLLCVLGIGYMCIEIPLIQKLSLLFELRYILLP